jgi:peptidyl-prolyl cis-trans isomerase A (cyclophilin A)
MKKDMRPQTYVLLPVVICALMIGRPGVSQTQRAASAPAAPTPVAVEPTGPTVVLDTSAGRILCKLYTKEAPLTTANFIALATGEKDWTGSDGGVQHAKPFFDGLQVFGVTDGIGSGERAAFGLGNAGPASAAEKTGLDFDRAGRLAAVAPKGQQDSSKFQIIAHADLEKSRGAVVFGQCDEVGIAIVAGVSHELLSTDNHPEHPVVLRKAMIVAEGEAMPPMTPAAPGEATLTIPPLPAPAVPAPEPTGPDVKIETSMGTMSCKLFSKEAPIGVTNFVGLATGTKPYKNPTTHAEVRGKHFYDGLTFKRVLPDFMVQNADIPDDPKGGGDIGFKFDNEIVPGLTFDRPGRLAYANAGPGTNASEFFITEHAVHRLDGNYTIFGQCDDATVKIVEAIARVPRDAHNKPLTPVVIKHVAISGAQ